MMPRAANARSFHQPLRERTVIVAARGSDREDLVVDTHQQDILVADMPQQFVVFEGGERYALAQIGATGRGLLLCHHCLPDLWLLGYRSRTLRLAVRCKGS